MTEHYNLLDTPWLPVRLANGEVREMGLLEVFREAERISALAETEPPSLIAQYRLLLAITHRALLLEYGAWKDSGRLRWFREGCPLTSWNATWSVGESVSGCSIHSIRSCKSRPWLAPRKPATNRSPGPRFPGQRQRQYPCRVRPFL